MRKQGNNAAACQLFEKAVSLDPESCDAWFNFGLALEAEGMLAEALYCYEWGAALGDEEAVQKGRALRDQGVTPTDPTLAFDQARQSEEQERQIIEQEQQELTFGQLLDKLKKLVRVSRRLRMDQVAKYLGVDIDEMFPRLVDWGEEFGFVLDRDEIDFSGSQVEAFIEQLDKEFASWGDDGKVENE